MQGLQAIERNSRIQAQMISDLLDYAGITFRQGASGDRDDRSVSGRARRARCACGAAARAAGSSSGCRSATSPLRIEADAARLQQIVWNLLSNAVKFSTRGGEVMLAARRNGDAFRLVVTDHGKGIEPQFLPRIFERFSQQDATTTRSHGGLGLGHGDRQAADGSARRNHSGGQRGQGHGRHVHARDSLEPRARRRRIRATARRCARWIFPRWLRWSSRTTTMPGN